MNKKKIASLIDPRFYQGIAHRGLHNDQYTENGLKAFKNAIDKGVAFEFDIHLTKDNELVVCHDENLKRTTAKDGIIEDLSLIEIKDKYRLLDKGEIPTLQEVIDLNHNQVPMVIELKVFRKNYKPLSEAFKKYLPQLDKKKTLIISFDPRSLWPLKRSGFIRSLLVAKSDEYTWFFKHSVESVDVEDVLLEEKRVQRYYKKHFINVWTIQKEEQLDRILPFVDTVTYQHLSPELVKEKLSK